MKELHLKERILQEKERNIKHDFAESKTLVTFDNSPINIKNQIDINQKRVNSSILSNKNLLTPPHLEPQKYYGASNYLMVKSPKTDLIKIKVIVIIMKKIQKKLLIMFVRDK